MFRFPSQASFAERIDAIRKQEVATVWATNKIGAIFGLLLFSAPTLIGVAAIGAPPPPLFLVVCPALSRSASALSRSAPPRSAPTVRCLDTRTALTNVSDVLFAVCLLFVYCRSTV